MKYVTVTEMQAIEREANAAGLTYEIMMENAGGGLGAIVESAYSHLAYKKVLGLVGSGNNGGDTLVALAYLEERGWKSSAYIVRRRQADDPLTTRLETKGGRIYSVEDDPDLDKLDALLKDNSVILDGVLGTGITLPLRGKVAEVLEKTKQTIIALDKSPIVVAVDCPSGVDCDSGLAAQETIPADLTVTMAAVKAGLLKLPAFALCGEIRVVGIGLTDDIKTWQSVHRWVADAEWVRERLPKRPLDAHKGTFGTALIVAGCLDYTGAALLAGKAAYLCGTGLVTLAVIQPVHAALAGHFPEATWVLLPEESGVIARDASEVITDHIGRATALLIGPGFGLEIPTREFLSDFLFRQRSTKIPALVIDADGLKLLAHNPDWGKQLPADTILTPHPGEMAILSGLSIEEIQSERLKVAGQYANAWGHIVVLKGAFTVVAAPDGRVVIVPVASPALARAGTGDVLAGLIVGLRAQGVQAFEAAAMGAWMHAQAGIKAAEYKGSTASVLAGDVLDGVVTVMKEL